MKNNARMNEYESKMQNNEMNTWRIILSISDFELSLYTTNWTSKTHSNR